MPTLSKKTEGYTIGCDMRVPDRSRAVEMQTQRMEAQTPVAIEVPTMRQVTPNIDTVPPLLRRLREARKVPR
jgi:hypothetical protein